MHLPFDKDKVTATVGHLDGFNRNLWKKKFGLWKPLMSRCASYLQCGRLQCAESFVSSPLMCESGCAVTYSRGPWGGKMVDSLTGGQKETAQAKINQPAN